MTQIKPNNTTKIKILQCLADGAWRTSHQIACTCRIRLTNAAELLRRYCNQGIISRHRNFHVPNGYIYRITNVGVHRLQYLTAVKQQLDFATYEYQEDVQAASTLAELVGIPNHCKKIFSKWANKKLGVE